MNDEMQITRTQDSSVLNDADTEGKYLTFMLEGQSYGVPIADVLQIVSVQPITTLGDDPIYFKGVINLRGIMIPVIDLRLRLGKPEKAHDERTCIVISLIADTPVGFLVDEVDAVVIIDETFISPPPHIAGSSNNHFAGIARLEDNVVLLLTIGKLLSEDQLLSLPIDF